MGVRKPKQVYLKRINIFNFKNYEHQDVEWSPGFNCLFGNNGMGKTNLLDAIYFLCMTKSHFNLPDTSIVRRHAEYMRLEGYFQRLEQPEKIVAKFAPRKLKVFERNEAPYERLADHIGLLPVVFIAPDDTELLTEGSEARRRFIDNTLCQTDPQYLRELMLYNRVLQQRNALLKQAGGNARQIADLIGIYDRQLLPPAAYIFSQRTTFAERFSQVFLRMYARISRESEQVEIAYRSALQEQPLEKLLQLHFDKDCALQRTSAGIHRDDLDCQIDGLPVKRFASQGQRKSYLLALKLAQYELLRSHKGFNPLLLLDDLFDKLDPLRTRQLLELLSTDSFGQVFITDTQATRLAPLLPELDRPYKVFEVKQGEVG